MTSPSDSDARLATPVADGQTLHKGFTLRSAWALAFADVSPIVALYAIFTLGLVAAGPAFWWAFPIVLAGQLLVACVFGELASRWPYEGSVYQWARHVSGTGSGWFAAWAYMWGLTIALSTLAYGAAGFLLEALGVSEPGKWVTVLTALVILVLGSLANIVGRRTLKILVTASLVCEVLASVGLGTVLLLFYRVNPFGVLFEGAGGAQGGLWTAGPMLAAAAYVGWSFVGFEAAGSIAEEVDEPERNVPKALIFSLLAVGVVVMYSGAALILAIPDLSAAVSGEVADPVGGTLIAHFGSAIARPMLVMFVIGFLASFLAVQAAVSRVIWASARDRALPGARLLGRLAGAERLPVNAIILTGAGAAVFVLLSGSALYAVLVNFTTIGFYIAFGLPVWGAAIAHLRGKWRPGAFTLGRLSAPVTYLAALWLAFQTVNICWPRDTGQAWYVEWSMVITLAVVGVAGIALYSFWSKRIMPAIGESTR
ncbi:amino acid/polyamine/organocation transporter, APC superfamily [Streptosporangium subroseum]|uniref:Amino acid/polyamine/organocation transporter, APC superfamily n=1 Tax=Streptosporangium subroseum TaxID=106412 RepID=A0A239LEG1_9ACTN|nr:amino acid permease [Streptosporangium subroseum]SNT27924.1 amino acid/polyamine/organocation transporter, APC superfamily [Streptosporangium subroseum]